MNTWQDQLGIMTRVLVNDFNQPQKYTDDYLQRVIICAAVLTSSDIELDNTYAMDISALTIAPDPILIGDTEFQALVPLKSACILQQEQYAAGISRAIKVRDGDSAIDTTAGFKGFRDILELGPCHVYEQLLWRLRAGGSHAAGVVMGPYRPHGVAPIESVSFFYDALSGYFDARRRILGIL